MAAEKKEFPNVGVDEGQVKAYLEEIRDGGSINMFGAAPLLESEFDMGRNDARAALVWWMEQY